MTYQEILEHLSTDTIEFISNETNKYSIDPCLIMEIMDKTIIEINYTNTVKALINQRQINNDLIEQLKVCQPLESE